MTQQFIDIGNFPDDPSADAIRTAFAKAQNNFSELYSITSGNTSTGVTSVNNTPGAGITVNSSTGAVVVSANMAQVQVHTNTLSIGRNANGNADTTINSSSQVLWVDLPRTINISNTAGTLYLGNNVGNGTQHANVIAIGDLSGNTALHNNTIIMNATGSDLPTAGANRIYAKPVRDISHDVSFDAGNALYYDSTTGEIGYAPGSGGSSGNIRVSGTSVAIGVDSGNSALVANTVAIGYLAGNSFLSPNSIVLNATGSDFVSTNDGFFVKPVRLAPSGTGYTGLSYDATSGEILYGASNVSLGNLTVSDTTFYTINPNYPIGFSPNTQELAEVTTISGDINNLVQDYYSVGIATTSTNIVYSLIENQSVGYIVLMKYYAVTVGGLLRSMYKLDISDLSPNALSPLSLAVDNNDNLLVALEDPTLNVFYIVKLDSLLNILWQTELTPQHPAATWGQITVDGYNNVHIGLSVKNSTDTVIGEEIIMFNSSGVLQWQRQLVESTQNLVGTYGTVTDIFGNTFTAGYLETDGVGFVAKYDISGTLIWKKSVNSGNINAIAIGYDNSIIIAFDIDLGGGITSGGVAKFDPTFTTQQWMRYTTTTSPVIGIPTFRCSSLTIDSNNNVYAVGTAFGTDLCVQKYDTNGSLLWKNSVNTLFGTIKPYFNDKTVSSAAIYKNANMNGEQLFVSSTVHSTAGVPTSYLGYAMTFNSAGFLSNTSWQFLLPVLGPGVNLGFTVDIAPNLIDNGGTLTPGISIVTDTAGTITASLSPTNPISVYTIPLIGPPELEYQTWGGNYVYSNHFLEPNGAVEFGNVFKVSSTGTTTISGNYDIVTEISAANNIVVHNFANSSVFNHTGMLANFTVDVINLNLANSRATSIELILNQGSTAYVPTNLAIANSLQTIKWLGGSQPSGNPNKIDVVTFDIKYTSPTYTVLGELKSYG